MDATSSARFSDRMARTSWGRSVSGTRTSRRRVDGVLRQGTSITLQAFFFLLELAAFASVSSMTSRSDWTSIRTTWLLMMRI
jgi:hypothetical protein